MLKNKRGSVTMTAFIAMIFLTIYGIIIYGNSVSKYIIQSNAIENIQSIYSNSVSMENMKTIFTKNNGKTIILD